MVTECPGCGSKERTKSGIVKGRQRWRCKGCDKRYSVERRSMDYPKQMRRQALELYLEGLGFRAIGRFLKVSYVTVFGWIKEFGLKTGELKSDAAIEVVELDELHSYVGNKKTIAGYGLLLIDLRSGSSLLCAAQEGQRPQTDS
jgi:transposase-like protein